MNEKERFIMLCRKNNRLRNQIRASKKLCKKVDKYTKHKNKLLVEKKLINAMLDEYEKQFGGKFTRL